MSSNRTADVTEHLTAQFAGRVPAHRVAAEVRDAERDLRGQVRAGARPELLHRLVTVRLEELARR